ncbi:MAG: hypothetical protein ACRCVN_00855 [Spirochaetia bacterium]
MYLVTQKYTIKNSVSGEDYHNMILEFTQHTKQIRGCFAFDIFKKIHKERILLFITYWQGVEYYHSYWEHTTTKKVTENLQKITQGSPWCTYVVLQPFYFTQCQKWHRLYTTQTPMRTHHPGAFYWHPSHKYALNEYRPCTKSALEFVEHHRITQKGSKPIQSEQVCIKELAQIKAR